MTEQKEAVTDAKLRDLSTAWRTHASTKDGECTFADLFDELLDSRQALAELKTQRDTAMGALEGDDQIIAGLHEENGQLRQALAQMREQSEWRPWKEGDAMPPDGTYWVTRSSGADYWAYEATVHQRTWPVGMEIVAYLPKPLSAPYAPTVSP